MLWVLRVFGYPVLTFGPEFVTDELEDGIEIDNTGGDFPLATELLSAEDEDHEIPPDDPQYGFGFGR